MKNDNKTREQLFKEIELLKDKIAKLEKSETELLSAEQAGKQAEKTLRESHELLKITHNTLLDAIISIDMNYNIVSCNKAVQNIFGYTPDELVGKNYSILVSKEMFEDPKLQTRQEELYKKGYLMTDDYYFKRKNGEIFPARFSVAVTRDEQGNPTGLVGSVHDITEGKQAENKLRESEERYRSLVESTEDSIYLISRDLTYLYANAKVLSRRRCSIDELIGAEYGKFHSAQATSRFSGRIKQVLESDKSLVYEYQSAQDQRYFLRTLSPVINPETKVVIAVTVISKDITERKKLEEKLLSERDEFNSILQELPVGVTVLDSEDKYVYINPMTMKIDGYQDDPDSLIGKDVRSNHPKHTLAIIDDLLNNFKSGRKSYSSREAKREKRSVEISYHAIRNTKGEYQGVIRLVSDITERKHAEEMIHESEEKFRNLAENSPNMIFINQGGKVVYANKVCEEITEYTTDEFYSRDFDFNILIQPEYTESIMANFKRHIEGKEVPPVEYAIRTKSGKRVEAIINTKLITYQEGKAILGIVTDITERKLAEEELKEKMDELEHFNRFMVGRELKMVELKREVNELLEKSGQSKKYTTPDEVK